MVAIPCGGGSTGSPPTVWGQRAANGGIRGAGGLEVGKARADEHHVEWRDLGDVVGPVDLGDVVGPVDLGDGVGPVGPVVGAGWRAAVPAGRRDPAGQWPAGAVDGGWPLSVVCPGTLVVHVDGTAAACSEELDGRCCSGADVAHRQRVSCRDLLGLGGCDTCGTDLGDLGDHDGLDDDPFVRHAVRVAVMATRRPRCHVHRRRPAP